jgi:FecR-like protein
MVCSTQQHRYTQRVSWRVRLVVRTQPSQGWCTGSTPVRAAMLACALLLWCALVSSCREGITRQVTATVLSMQDPVVSWSDKRRDSRRVTLQTRLPCGSRVKTLNDGWLDVAVLSGVLAQVSSNSEIKIEELKISKDGNDTGDAMRNRIASIRLNQGQITVLFVRRGKAASRLLVRTERATVVADSDCLFRVRSDPAKTRVTCVQGAVNALPEAQRAVTIGSGYFLEWPSPRAKPVAASDDAGAQIDIAASLEIETRLDQLQSDLLKRRPF